MKPDIYLEFESSYRGIGIGWYAGKTAINTPSNEYLYRLSTALTLKINDSKVNESEYLKNVFYQVGLLGNNELKEIIDCDPPANEEQKLFLRKEALNAINQK